MPNVSFSATLPYKAADLYNLVMDIEQYPEIFEDIEEVGMTITGEHSRNVDVRITALFMSVAYNCDVKGEPGEKISIRSLSGDFKSMNAEWRFEAQDDGQTRVSYDMEFDLGGFLKNMAAQGFIQDGVDKTRREMEAYAARTLPRVDSGPQ